jgi:hypothetical protein
VTTAYVHNHNTGVVEEAKENIFVVKMMYCICRVVNLYRANVVI